MRGSSLFTGLLLAAALPSRADAPVPNVGMDEYIVARAADYPVVRTFGATTCVILALHDPVAQVGALAHISAEADVRRSLDAVFPILEAAGAKPANLRAQMFGGWRNDKGGMFKDEHWTSSEIVAAIKASLARRGVPVVRDETLVDPDPARSNGAKSLRSIELDLRTGQATDIAPGPGIDPPTRRSPEEEKRFQRVRQILPAPFSFGASPP